MTDTNNIEGLRDGLYYALLAGQQQRIQGNQLTQDEIDRLKKKCAGWADYLIIAVMPKFNLYPEPTTTKPTEMPR